MGTLPPLPEACPTALRFLAGDAQHAAAVVALLPVVPLENLAALAAAAEIAVVTGVSSLQPVAAYAAACLAYGWFDEARQQVRVSCQVDVLLICM
jgi:hypothetical protein